MGTTLITVCSDESFAVRLNDYLRTHWGGTGCDSYISAGGAEDVYGALDSAPGGGVAALLVENDLLDASEGEITRFRCDRPSKFREYRLAVLTGNNGDLSASREGVPHIFMFDRPSRLLADVRRFAEKGERRSGVVAVFSADGMARLLFEPGGIHEWLVRDGYRVRLVSTDEYARGAVWSSTDDGFLRMLCDARSRRLRDFESYAAADSEPAVITAEGCAPDIYELSPDEAEAAAGVICSSWTGVTLVMLGAAASALNLKIMERCSRLVFVGDLSPAERVFGRNFGGDTSNVMDRIRFIGSEELAQCRRTGDWDAVWEHA